MMYLYYLMSETDLGCILEDGLEVQYRKPNGEFRSQLITQPVWLSEEPLPPIQNDASREFFQSLHPASTPANDQRGQPIFAFEGAVLVKVRVRAWEQVVPAWYVDIIYMPIKEALNHPQLDESLKSAPGWYLASNSITPNQIVSVYEWSESDSAWRKLKLTRRLALPDNRLRRLTAILRSRLARREHSVLLKAAR